MRIGIKAAGYVMLLAGIGGCVGQVEEVPGDGTEYLLATDYGDTSVISFAAGEEIRTEVRRTEDATLVAVATHPVRGGEGVLDVIGAGRQEWLVPAGFELEHVHYALYSGAANRSTGDEVDYGRRCAVLFDGTRVCEPVDHVCDFGVDLPPPYSFGGALWWWSGNRDECYQLAAGCGVTEPADILYATGWAISRPYYDCYWLKRTF